MIWMEGAMKRQAVFLGVLMCVGPVHAQHVQHVPEGSARPDPPALKEVSKDFPTGGALEARVMTATLEPGTTSPWHTHSAPVAVYVVDGTFTLEMEDRTVSLKSGQAMLEPVNVKMRAANRDTTPVRVVIFQVSPPEDPFLVPSK
ncbi:cupin domain-containing protein [Arenibaculum pallidiluteum]|uniref:cupin domain-containing protein n=1 Tax=Arenibaculum pallidiluteum TaxID=2812559 RepID=UPI001A971FB4|nr:cupin domain-containing protein [Arenibaculum pallidiluteum]